MSLLDIKKLIYVLKPNGNGSAVVKFYKGYGDDATGKLAQDNANLSFSLIYYAESEVCWH